MQQKLKKFLERNEWKIQIKTLTWICRLTIFNSTLSCFSTAQPSPPLLFISFNLSRTSTIRSKVALTTFCGSQGVNGKGRITDEIWLFIEDESIFSIVFVCAEKFTYSYSQNLRNSMNKEKKKGNKDKLTKD